MSEPSRPPSALRALLEAHPDLDLAHAAPDPGAWLASLGLDPASPQSTAIQGDLQACRRLLQVLPGADWMLALALVERGLRSAVQLAQLPRSRFLAEFGDLFDRDPVRVDAVLDRARAVRQRVLLHYMHERKARDPHLPRVLSGKRS